MKAGAQAQPNESESQILGQPLGLKRCLQLHHSGTWTHFPDVTVFDL